MSLYEQMESEIEADTRVKAGFEITGNKELEDAVGDRIDKLKSRRDQLMIEAVQQAQLQLSAGESKLADTYRTALRRRYEELLQQKQKQADDYVRDEITRIESLAKEVNLNIGDIKRKIEPIDKD